MRVEHTVEIDRPVDAVFAFLSDPDNLPKWQSGLLGVTKQPGPIGVGARHRETRSMFGAHVEQTVEVTALEPGARLDLRVVEGPVHVSVAHRLASLDQRTRVTVVGEGHAGGLSFFVGPFFALSLRRHLEGDLRRLKTLLESTPAP